MLLDISATEKREGWKGYFQMLLHVLLLLCSGAVLADASVWLLVDTQAHVLKVMEGDRVIQVFEGIAIGRGGVARNHMRRRGDQTTPLGRFRIAWINPKSRYHLFFGLNYPTLPYATTAYREGWISDTLYRRLIAAHFEGGRPPQDTPLGGYIGIHGLGRADPKIHRLLDWTEGCIALTNEQIERLRRWVKVGTQVVIR